MYRNSLFPCAATHTSMTACRSPAAASSSLEKTRTELIRALCHPQDLNPSAARRADAAAAQNAGQATGPNTNEARTTRCRGERPRIWQSLSCSPSALDRGSRGSAPRMRKPRIAPSHRSHRVPGSPGLCRRRVGMEPNSVRERGVPECSSDQPTAAWLTNGKPRPTAPQRAVGCVLETVPQRRLFSAYLKRHRGGVPLLSRAPAPH